MTIERMWRDKPVTIIPGKEGTRLHVNNTAQARRVLDEEWPIERGPRLEAARQAVHNAKVSALKAREAFYAAADEAGIVTSTTVAPASIPASEGPALYGRGRKRKLKRDQ